MKFIILGVYLKRLVNNCSLRPLNVLLVMSKVRIACTTLKYITTCNETKHKTTNNINSINTLFHKCKKACYGRQCDRLIC